MAKNYINDGGVIDWTNNTADPALSGEPVVIGNQQLGIALVDIAVGATGSVAKEGVFYLPKPPGAIVHKGQKLWWKISTGEVVPAPVINAYFIGYATTAEQAEAATVNVEIEEFSEEGPRVLILAATGAQTLNDGDFGGGECVVFAPNTAAQAINLPSVAAIPPGSKLFVKKTDAAAAAITLKPSGAEQIAGAANFAAIDANNDLAQFVSTGTAWVLMHSTIA